MFSGNQMFARDLWANGPAPGQFYNFTGGFHADISNNCKEYTTPGLFGTQRTSSPITTGTSVVGIKFDGGVIIAADNLVSYGSLARYQNVQRVFKVNEKTIIGASGDFADFQYLKRSIDQKVVEDMCHGDDVKIWPRSMYNWLTRVLYNRRSKINPLWVNIVVGGMDESGEPFLGHVDLRGRAYQDDIVATGFGRNLALPLAREQLVKGQKLTQHQASEVLRKCMEVLYYRDCRAMPKYTVAVCTKEGSVVQGPFNVNENWQLANMVQGY